MADPRSDAVREAAPSRAHASPQRSAYFRELTRDIREAAGHSGKRVHPQAFRHSLAAELLLEGCPLPYIQAQLGIVSLYAMERFLNTSTSAPVRR